MPIATTEGENASPDDADVALWTRIPAATAMVISPVSYLSAVRTTLCDIMCTSNRAFAMDGNKIEALKPVFTAKLPYPKMRSGSVADIKQTPGFIGTGWQTVRINDIKSVKTNDLKRDRNQYFDKLAEEKALKDAARTKSAILIQRMFRGYSKRISMGRIKIFYSPKHKRRFVTSQINMQDDLCRLFAKLPLKPIDGLNLEPRSKTSRRKARFENAAAYRLQRFFARIVAMVKARRLVAVKKEQFVDKCARICTRAIRFMRTKLFTKKCMVLKANKTSVKIQCAFRTFRAKSM
jgi:hypothetical protein